MQLYQLAYVSCSNLTGDAFRKSSELQDLVDQSRAYNTAHNVTGLLLFSGNHFAQVIEGTDHTIVELYRRICADKRHASVKRLVFEPIEKRQFAGWSMAIKQLSAPGGQSFEGSGPHESALRPTRMGGHIVELLEFLLLCQESTRLTVETLLTTNKDAAYRDMLSDLIEQTSN